MEKTLHRDRYVSPEWFGAEREKIFFDQWFCVGRAEEIPSPGDHLVCDVLGESILITRTKESTIAGYANLCRHRGSRLSSAPGKPGQTETGPSGTFRGAIQCPYHAWTYNLIGDLKAAPFLDEDDGLKKADLPLHKVGVELWGGFIWVHLSPDRAMALGSQFQESTEYLRNYPLSQLQVASRVIYEVGANWKAVVENFNECYHCGPVHPELSELVPAFKKRGGSELDWVSGIPHREGAWTFTASGTTDRSPFPGLSDEEKTRHKGQLIYPNLMLSLSADHVAAFTLWPHSPDSTTVVCDFLFHPDEMGKDTFDPFDAVDFWDMVNRQDWAVCENVQKGMSSKFFETGFYAPMEDYSMDIRRYLDERM